MPKTNKLKQTKLRISQAQISINKEAWSPIFHGSPKKREPQNVAMILINKTACITDIADIGV